MVADVQVNMKTGKFVAKHLYIAQNNGITVGPQLVANQMSGAAIQGLSRAMWEQPPVEQPSGSRASTGSPTRSSASRTTPTVTLVNVHPGQYITVNPDLSDGRTRHRRQPGNTNAFNDGWLLTGSGEPPTAAVGSAMANAFFDATGARIRQSPMRPATVRGALKAAGVA